MPTNTRAWRHLTIACCRTERMQTLSSTRATASSSRRSSPKALRETSVLFGALIAIVFLKEPLRAGRVAAALMIVVGLTLIRSIEP
jgi:uncharacterized membrane protein